MESDSIEPSLVSIKGIAILDQDGKRILAKYYDKDALSTVKQQKDLEAKLFAKTQRANAEIIMMEGTIVQNHFGEWGKRVPWGKVDLPLFSKNLNSTRPGTRPPTSRCQRQL